MNFRFADLTVHHLIVAGVIGVSLVALFCACSYLLCKLDPRRGAQPVKQDAEEQCALPVSSPYASWCDFSHKHTFHSILLIAMLHHNSCHQRRSWKRRRSSPNCQRERTLLLPSKASNDCQRSVRSVSGSMDQSKTACLSKHQSNQSTWCHAPDIDRCCSCCCVCVRVCSCITDAAACNMIDVSRTLAASVTASSCR